MMDIRTAKPSCFLSKTFVATLLLGCAVPVLAQQQAAPTPASGTARSEPDSTDIIVTATKRSERLQDVPVSVQAIGPALIAQTGAVTTTQLPNLAPGLSYTGSGQPKLASFYVRGVGTYALSPALESSVGVAVDGVPLARVNGSVADLVDIDHVEVLKGPQGMLFGKNATAGLISIVSRKPVIGETNGVAHASYGSYNELNVDATVNYSPSDGGAFRLSAWRYGHDGFVRGQDGRKYNDKNSYGVRLGITVRPTETIGLTVVGQYDGRDENGTVQTLRAYSAISSPAVIAYNNSVGYFPSVKSRQARLGIPSLTKGDNIAITGLVDWDIGGGYTVSSITSYRDIIDRSVFDTLGTDTPTFRLFDLLDISKYNQFTQELRIASPSANRLSFVAGLFYYDFSVKDSQNTGLIGIPGGTVYDRNALIKNTLTDYAVFGEATLRVLPGLRLIAGARQSHDRTRGSIVKTPVGADAGPVGGPVAALINFSSTPVKYDFTSWRFGGQADIARDVMLYATASRGYKGPGFNLSISTTPANLLTAGVPNNALVEAETAKSYEAGIKSQFFDRRLTLNVTAFHSIFSNFQTTVTAPVVPSQFVIQNAKQLKSDGVELELSARPVRGLTFGVNAAYIHARYTDYNNAPCYTSQPALPAGSAMTPGFCIGGNGTSNSAGVQSLNGVQVAASPKWSANANVRYETALGSDWRGFAGGDYSYRSRTKFEGTNNPINVQQGYGVFNLSGGFGPQSEHWTVSFYVRNVFKKYFVNRARDGNGFYFNLNAYEAQRRIGGQLEMKF